MSKYFYFEQFSLPYYSSNVKKKVIFQTIQSGPGSDANEGVLRIPQSSRITATSPSDCLVSYPRHMLRESYPSAEVHSVYSTTPADWETHSLKYKDR